MRVVLQCPAKINTFLAVGPVDEYGYHPIRTVFQAVGLYDILAIEHATEPAITSNWDGLPPDNTLSKTLRFVSEYALVPNLLIHVEKRIPTQSGLGGGSSNAAGLLRAIQPFLPQRLDDSILHDIASAVGKDVPFFLNGGRAIGEGYGEVLTPIAPSAYAWAVIAQPESSCSTAAMYDALDRITYDFHALDDHDETYNDFERVAPPDCLELIEQLRTSGLLSGLSGSGSAAFGLAKSEAEALRVASRIQAPFVATVPLPSGTEKGSL